MLGVLNIGASLTQTLILASGTPLASLVRQITRYRPLVTIIDTSIWGSKS